MQSRSHFRQLELLRQIHSEIRNTITTQTPEHLNEDTGCQRTLPCRIMEGLLVIREEFRSSILACIFHGLKSRSLHFGVLRFRLLQDRDVWVGVLP